MIWHDMVILSSHEMIVTAKEHEVYFLAIAHAEVAPRAGLKGPGQSKLPNWVHILLLCSVVYKVIGGSETNLQGSNDGGV